MIQALPVVALRGVVFMPNVVVHTAIGRPQSIAAVDIAVREFGNKVLFLTQCTDVFSPSSDDLYQVGTIARVITTSWLDEERTQFQMLADTDERVRVLSVETHGVFIKAQIDSMPDLLVDSADTAPLVLRIRAAFERYYKNDLSREMRLMAFEKITDLPSLVNRLANEHFRSFPVADQQAFLEEINFFEKLQRLLKYFETSAPISTKQG